MTSGRQVLEELNQTLAQARKHLDEVDRDLDTSAQALASNVRAQARTLRRLAQIRLEALERGELETALEAADNKARDALERRGRVIAALDEKIDQAQTTLDRLEQERDASHDALEAAAQDVTDREAAAQKQLESDAEYTSRLNAVSELDAQAEACKAKTVLAREDEDAKGDAYRDDPLFAYLWEREYGTSDYKANPITRLLDAWVARLCRYEQARRDYWMLKELPGRLEEHAKALREAADEALIALWKIETATANEAGIESARKALKIAEARQDGLDERIVEAEKVMRALLDERGEFAAGEDGFIERSRTAMAEAMGGEAIDGLLAMAAKTETPEDDELVSELERLRQEERDLRDELAEHRDLHASYADRLGDLEDVRRRFKSARYDDRRSDFSDDVANLIGGLIGGAIAGGALWKGLQRQQRFRESSDRWSDFGAGGLMNKRKKSGGSHRTRGED